MAELDSPVISPLRRNSVSSIDRIAKGELRHYLKLDKSFGRLSPQEFDEIVPKFTCIKFKEADILIHQGDPSDSFYFLTDGKVEVWIERDGASKCDAVLGAGAALGAQGIMYGRPRNATVVAATRATAWRLPAEVYVDAFQTNRPVRAKSTMRKQWDHLQLKEFLKGDRIFARLNDAQLDELVDKFERVKVENTQTIMQQGEDGADFFMLTKGTCEVWVEKNGHLKCEFKAQPGVGFGAQALLYSKPRSATVVAQQGAILWRLSKEDFLSAIATTSPRQQQQQQATSPPSTERRKSRSASVDKQPDVDNRLSSSSPLASASVSSPSSLLASSSSPSQQQQGSSPSGSNAPRVPSLDKGFEIMKAAQRRQSTDSINRLGQSPTISQQQQPSEPVRPEVCLESEKSLRQQLADMEIAKDAMQQQWTTESSRNREISANYESRISALQKQLEKAQVAQINAERIKSDCEVHVHNMEKMMEEARDEATKQRKKRESEVETITAQKEELIAKVQHMEAKLRATDDGEWARELQMEHEARVRSDRTLYELERKMHSTKHDHQATIRQQEQTIEQLKAKISSLQQQLTVTQSSSAIVVEAERDARHRVDEIVRQNDALKERNTALERQISALKLGNDNLKNQLELTQKNSAMIVQAERDARKRSDAAALANNNNNNNNTNTSNNNNNKSMNNTNNNNNEGNEQYVTKIAVLESRLKDALNRMEIERDSRLQKEAALEAAKRQLTLTLASNPNECQHNLEIAIIMQRMDALEKLVKVGSTSSTTPDAAEQVSLETLGSRLLNLESAFFGVFSGDKSSMNNSSSSSSNKEINHGLLSKRLQKVEDAAIHFRRENAALSREINGDVKQIEILQMRLKEAKEQIKQLRDSIAVGGDEPIKQLIHVLSSTEEKLDFDDHEIVRLNEQLKKERETRLTWEKQRSSSSSSSAMSPTTKSGGNRTPRGSNNNNNNNNVNSVDTLRKISSNSEITQVLNRLNNLAITMPPVASPATSTPRSHPPISADLRGEIVSIMASLADFERQIHVQLKTAEALIQRERDLRSSYHSIDEDSSYGYPHLPSSLPAAASSYFDTLQSRYKLEFAPHHVPLSPFGSPRSVTTSNSYSTTNNPSYPVNPIVIATSPVTSTNKVNRWDHINKLSSVKKAIQWVSTVLSNANINHIEDFIPGDIFCLLANLMFPGSIVMAKIYMGAQYEWQYFSNLKYLQLALTQFGTISPDISGRAKVDITSIMNGNPRAVWHVLKWFYDNAAIRNMLIEGIETAGDYQNVSPFQRGYSGDFDDADADWIEGDEIIPGIQDIASRAFSVLVNALEKIENQSGISAEATPLYFSAIESAISDGWKIIAAAQDKVEEICTREREQRRHIFNCLRNLSELVAEERAALARDTTRLKMTMTTFTIDSSPVPHPSPRTTKPSFTSSPSSSLTTHSSSSKQPFEAACSACEAIDAQLAVLKDVMTIGEHLMRQTNYVVAVWPTQIGMYEKMLRLFYQSEAVEWRKRHDELVNHAGAPLLPFPVPASKARTLNNA